VVNGLARRNQDFAAEMTAFLLGRKLVLKVNTSRTRFNHRFNQLEDVQAAAESCLRIGHNRRHPVRTGSTLMMIDLISTEQCVINTPDYRWYTICRIETLVRVHLFRKIGIRGYLPSTEINRLQSCSDLLHCLIPRQRTKRPNCRLRIEQSPEPFGASPRQRKFYPDRAAKPVDILLRVGPGDSLPSLSGATVRKRHFSPPFREGFRRFRNRNLTIRSQNKSRFPGRDS
jgi:hypothetical protein